METLAATALVVHIVFGTAGMLAFWVPVLTRKGGPLHKRFGKLFLWSANIMLAAAAVALVASVTQLVRSGGSPATAPDDFALLFLLGQLIVLVWVTVRHGVLVLRYKRDPVRMDTWTNRLLAGSVILASMLLIGYALWHAPLNRLVLLILATVGVVSGIDILRYIRGSKTGAQAWKVEHLSAMLGAGIAYHTAFAVFGMARLVELPLQGSLVLLPWLLPTLIGTPAILLWSRRC